MMATTHALAGVVLAAVASLAAPAAAPVALLAGAAGGVFPDLDLYGDHRRTLHFPVYYSLGATLALGLAVAFPTAATLALGCFLAAAALHSVTDALGGGVELRPWEGRSERAVYSHYHGRWLRPRRWVRYDGSPEDAALATGLGGLALWLAGPATRVPVGPAGLAAALSVEAVVAALVAVSIGYALVRRRLPDVWIAVVARLPEGLAARVPRRFAAED